MDENIPSVAPIEIVSPIEINLLTQGLTGEFGRVTETEFKRKLENNGVKPVRKKSFNPKYSEKVMLALIKVMEIQVINGQQIPTHVVNEEGRKLFIAGYETAEVLWRAKEAFPHLEIKIYSVNVGVAGTVINATLQKYLSDTSDKLLALVESETVDLITAEVLLEIAKDLKTGKKIQLSSTV